MMQPLDLITTEVAGVLCAGGPYRGGEVTRLSKSWQPSAYSGELAHREAWDLLSRRVRDLQRNDPAMVALKRALKDNVISTGISSAANAMLGEDLDDEFNTPADDEFEQWAETEADFYGRLSWHDMQRQAFDEALEVGECLLLRAASDDPSRYVPLCYQILEAEQIDSSMDRQPGTDQNEIVRGVELDRFRRPVAYWLFDVNPNDPHSGYSTLSRRITADRVIHVVNPGRPSQVRGISLYAAITQTARDLDSYLGAELTAANIGALFTLIHKTKTPGSGFGFVGDGLDENTGSDDYGNPKAKLGRGIVCQIGQDDSVEQVEAHRPNRDAHVFTSLILMLMGMGGNVSRYRMTRDYSGTTYVAARAAGLDDKAAFRPIQRSFGRTVCLPVRREWTRQAIALRNLGGISASMFRGQERRWLRATLQPPGWEQIDESGETEAATSRIESGLSTREDECGRMGKNWRRVITQLAREEAFAKSKGVMLGARPPSPNPSRARQEQQTADRTQTANGRSLSPIP